jgi:hypothetical protein
MKRAGAKGAVMRWMGPITALVAIGMAPPSAKDDPDDGSFGFTKPVACVEIKGYEDYVELSGGEITNHEKLIVYFRPRHFKTNRVGRQYESHFTEDVRVRRRGEKAVLWSKMKMVDYQPRADIPRPPIYFHNKIALKGLAPGNYELEIVLHDEIGQTPPATRVLPFVIVEPKEEPAEKKVDAGEAPEK